MVHNVAVRLLPKNHAHCHIWSLGGVMPLGSLRARRRILDQSVREGPLVRGSRPR